MVVHAAVKSRRLALSMARLSVLLGNPAPVTPTGNARSILSPPGRIASGEVFLLMVKKYRVYLRKRCVKFAALRLDLSFKIQWLLFNPLFTVEQHVEKKPSMPMKCNGCKKLSAFSWLNEPRYPPTWKTALNSIRTNFVACQRVVIAIALAGEPDLIIAMNQQPL